MILPFRAEHDRSSAHNELNQTRGAIDALAREKVVALFERHPTLFVFLSPLPLGPSVFSTERFK
jgi:hypothetical protein